MLEEKNPRRVEAGKINGSKRRPWNDEDRQRLRAQCLERRPWERSTGPRTLEGKLRARVNGYHHIPDPNSRRQVRVSLNDVGGLDRTDGEVEAIDIQPASRVE
jgi:hypothetical protein